MSIYVTRSPVSIDAGLFVIVKDMNNCKMIIIRGYPGSGKTTAAKLLSKRTGSIFIDHNAILTFLAGMVGDDRGIYSEIRNLELAMAKKIIEENKNVIVARGFSSSESITPYLAAAKMLGADVFVFRLAVSEDNLKLRVVAEDRKKDFNPTINEEALLEWIVNNPLQDIENEYEINANKSIDEVVNQMLLVISP